MPHPSSIETWVHMLESSRGGIYAQFDSNSHQYCDINIHHYKYAAGYREKVHMHSVLWIKYLQNILRLSVPF